MLGYVCTAIKINHEIWHVVPPVSGSVLRVPPHNCGARGLGTKYITATWVRNPAHPEGKEIAMVWRTDVGGACGTHPGFGEAGNERCGFYVATWQRRWLCWRSLSPTGLNFNAAKTLTPRHGKCLNGLPRHKWLGCMLVALNHNTFELPFTMVSRTSHANKRAKFNATNVSQFTKRLANFFGQLMWPLPRFFRAACHVHTMFFGVKFWGLLGSSHSTKFDGLTKRICFLFSTVFTHIRNMIPCWQKCLRLQQRCCFQKGDWNHGPFQSQFELAH